MIAFALAAVFVLGAGVGYWLRAQDVAQWARRSAARDLRRRGLAVPGPGTSTHGRDLDLWQQADLRWLREQGISDTEETWR